jgi:hypothetical protein
MGGVGGVGGVCCVLFVLVVCSCFCFVLLLVLVLVLVLLFVGSTDVLLLSVGGAQVFLRNRNSRLMSWYRRTNTLWWRATAFGNS